MRTARIRRQFEQVLPRIRTHASIAFRAVVCPHRREDLIAEAVALGWQWFLRLRRQGKKDPLTFISAIATYAAKAVRSGRRLCGQERGKEILSPLAQQRHGFTVSPIPAYSTLTTNPFAEALRDNTKTPVDEQVAFRCDFPAWLASYDERRRRIIAAMAEGERTQDLAQRFRISKARVSQLRREFLVSWRPFVGEP